MKLDPKESNALLETLLDNETKMDPKEFEDIFSKREVEFALRVIRERKQAREFMWILVTTGIAGLLAVGSKLWLPFFLNGTIPMFVIGVLVWFLNLGTLVYGIILLLKKSNRTP